MNYVVLWSPKAEAMLGRLWLASPNNSTIAEAARWLDKQLATMPLQLGEVETNVTTQRLAYRPPLNVAYEVLEDTKQVIVQAVFEP
jgi:hypothetical protein